MAKKDGKIFQIKKDKNMESLQLSFDAVMPIFIMMLLGYLLRKLNVADKKTFDTINKLVFRVFLPTLLFYNIYGTSSVEIFDSRLLVFAVVCVLLIFFIGFGAVFLITNDNRKRGVILQGFFRSNFAILGLPIVSYICKDSTVGLTSLMVAMVVPVYNVLGVISLEIFNGGKINLIKILKGIIKNPLIIGCVLGGVWLLLGIKLPYPLEKAVSDISNVASPLAIVALGASFSFRSIKGNIKENVIVVTSKLVFIPLIALSVAAYLGFRGEAFACLIVIFGGPIAVSSFSMAQQMGGDENLAGQIVVLTSALCIFTLFVFIFVFGLLGII